ncbi:hypothetical protein Q0P93_15360, partial [Staphylococcus aureus]|nr:hypothetical protein [Staphylococcus aureus]
ENVLPLLNEGHAKYTPVILLLAQAYAETADVAFALQLLCPIFPSLTAEQQRQMSEPLKDWLWDVLVFASYTPSNDHYYQLA